MQNFIAFIYTNNKLSERESKKNIQRTQIRKESKGIITDFTDTRRIMRDYCEQVVCQHI